MSLHASRTRRDRIALDTIEDLGQRDDVKRLDPMGHRRLGQPDRSDVILKRTGEGSPQRIQGIILPPKAVLIDVTMLVLILSMVHYM